MRNAKISAALLAVLCLPAASFAAQGSFTFKGRERTYLIEAPSGASKALGIMICLHCNSGTPATALAPWAKIVVKDGVMCVAPSSVNGSVNPWQDKEQDGIEYIKALVDHLAGKYRIDRKRIYCSGYSAGACHTMRIGIPNSDFFAGLIGYSGSSMQGIGPRKIPVVSIHGTSDRTIPIDDTIRMHNDLEAAGWPHKLFKIEGGGHQYNAKYDGEAWEFVKKNPPKDPPELIAKRAMEEGEKELKEKNYGKAYEAFQEALKTGALQTEANAAITKLIAAGEKEISDASEDEAALKKIQKAYRDTPVADAAKAALEKLADKSKSASAAQKKDESGKPGEQPAAEKTQSDKDSPAALLERADEYYRNKAYDAALNVLKKILKDYPDSPEARKASSLIEKIEKENE